MNNTDTLIGTILDKTFVCKKNQWFFYLWDGRNKVAVLLTEQMVSELPFPKDYKGKIKVQGRLTYHPYRKVLRMFPTNLETFNEHIDYRAQIKEMLAQA